LKVGDNLGQVAWKFCKRIVRPWAVS